MPVISKDPIETRPLGMRNPAPYLAPSARVPAPAAARAPALAPKVDAPTAPAPAPAVKAPIEYERKFVVPASALDKVLTFRNVERRMVYDTYLKPEVQGRPMLRFRFETSIDPQLGNSENGEPVVACADFTVKTGEDPLKRIEDIFPVRFTSSDTIGTLNAFNSIYGTRIHTERYRWPSREGNYQLVIYDRALGHMTVELEARDDDTAAVDAFKPPAAWREVTQDKRFSNYSIAAYGWPESDDA